MEDVVNFLQIRLERDFGYDDDTVIEALQSSMEELQKSKLLIPFPGRSPSNELPQRPFGLMVEPSLLEQKMHRRNMSMLQQNGGRSPTNLFFRKKGELDTSDYHSSNSHQHDSRNSYGEGSKYSYDPSIDEASSYAEGSRHNSITETSQTSIADLSMVSSVTLSRSQHLEENGNDLVPGDGAATPLSATSASSHQAASASVTSPAKMDEHRTRLQSSDSFYDNVPNDLGGGDQEGSESATPKFVESPDTVRIFVPYHLSTTTANSSSTRNGNVTPTHLDVEDANKIVIRVGVQASSKPFPTSGLSKVDVVESIPATKNLQSNVRSPDRQTNVPPLRLDSSESK